MARESRVDRLEEALGRLAGAQAHTEERLGRVEAALARLAEAQARTEERLGRVEAALARLAESQARTEEAVANLAERQARTEEAVANLAERQARTEERLGRVEAALARLAESQARTEEAVANLAERQARTEEEVRRLTVRVGDLVGESLERRYRERAQAYFDDLLHDIHALSAPDLAAALDQAGARGVISREERKEILETDVVVRGRRWSDGAEVYLAVEVSSVVDEGDVRRAARRSALLERAAGIPAIPVVAGKAMIPEAEQLARTVGAWRVLDGRAFPPEASALNA